MKAVTSVFFYFNFGGDPCGIHGATPFEILHSSYLSLVLYGVPKSILQEEIKNVKQQMRVRGMTMAAVLTDDPECPNLVAFFVYDMKPVYFLSMA